MKVVQNETYEGKLPGFNTVIGNSKFIKCKFIKCNLSKYKFTNCEFEDCDFINCNFYESFLALNKNYDSGRFLKCLFLECNLAKASFNFPIIDECEFRNCNLNETNFDGSRFSNTKFIGLLDSCFFRGYSIYATSNSLFSFSKFDATLLANQMINVDFSSSKMVGVSFTDKINLSSCLFPKGDRYVFISNLNLTVNKVLEVIESSYVDGYQRETAIKIIKFVHYNKNKQEQQSDFIDSFVAEEMSDEDEGVSLKVFNLIKSLQ